jgi:hypothetical protein
VILLAEPRRVGSGAEVVISDTLSCFNSCGCLLGDLDCRGMFAKDTADSAWRKHFLSSSVTLVRARRDEQNDSSEKRNYGDGVDHDPAV